MKQEELFAAAIGIMKPWFIEKVDLDIKSGELNIDVNFTRGSEFEYIDEETGEITFHKAYDTKVKTWRHLNFFQYRCYLHARVPRVKLPDGTVRQVKTTWEGNISGFTLLFEAFILQLTKLLPIHQVCQIIGTYDSKVWNMLRLYVDSCHDLSDFSKVTKIGVDETAARRGHDYVSLFVDLDEKKTIFVTEGKDSQTIKAFSQDLEEHNGDATKVEHVSCDMSQAFISGTEDYLPNAAITFDKFHIIKLINKAVDDVRKEEVKQNPILINSKFSVLKNRENLTVKQAQKLEEIQLSKQNIKTFRAMQIRESFQQIYSSPNSLIFEQMLKKWYFWATHSRIAPIIKVAKTIKSHWDGIVNWVKSKITNAILEGFNSLFQAAKAKARGYKKTETIKIIIYLITGKLDFSKVNSYFTTHSFL